MFPHIRNGIVKDNAYHSLIMESHDGDASSFIIQAF